MQYGALDYVVFNGYANQYVETPIPVRVGEPIRIFVVNAGPNIWSSFHVVGDHLRRGLRQRQSPQQAGRPAVDDHWAGGWRLRRVHPRRAGNVRRSQPRLRPRAARRDRPAEGGVATCGRAPSERSEAWHRRTLGPCTFAAEIERLPPDGPSGRRSETLVKTAGLRVVLVTMRAGTALREHVAPGTITVQPIRGRFVFIVEGEEREISAACSSPWKLRPGTRCAP